MEAAVNRDVQSRPGRPAGGIGKIAKFDIRIAKWRGGPHSGRTCLR